MQHEFQLSTASEYVETVEERRAAENSDKSASAAQSQERPKAAPHEITTMVDYIERRTSKWMEARTLYQLFTLRQRYSEDNPKMH